MTFGHVWTGQRTSRRVQCLHRRENHGRGKRSTLRYRTYCARNLQRKLSAWSSCGSLIHARDSSGGNLVTQRRIACEMEGRNQIDIKKNNNNDNNARCRITAWKISSNLIVKLIVLSRASNVGDDEKKRRYDITILSLFILLALFSIKVYFLHDCFLTSALLCHIRS